MIFGFSGRRYIISESASGFGRHLTTHEVRVLRNAPCVTYILYHIELTFIQHLTDSIVTVYLSLAIKCLLERISCISYELPANLEDTKRTCSE